tara:strand:- start:230 stop:2596 length:2367 start_codon:yes stop_codon:yes gene_type:complete
MFEITRVNHSHHSHFTSKFNQLQYNTLFVNSFNKYVDATYSSKKINHYWINHIIYYEIEDHLCIYFKKYFITKIKKDSNITYVDIKHILDKVVLTIKQLHIKLPIDYLFDILLELNLKQHFLILKHDTDERIHIQFIICNDIIQFFIKQNLFYECPIEKFNDLQQDIYNEYCSIEKSKRKIIYFNQEGNSFDCEDTVYDLQKYMYINDYWLDITFNFNKNRFQNNSSMNNKYNYFIKYDIFLFSNINCFKGILSSIDDDYFERYITNKIFILIPYSYSYDNFKRVSGEKSLFDRIRKNNNLFIGCRNSDTNIGISSLKCMFNQTVSDTNNEMMKVLNSTYNTYTNTLNCFDCDVLLPIYNNDNLLDKKDFFKIHNLDINKPLITFFTIWPVVVLNERIIHRFHFDNEIWAEDGYINELVTNLSENYNVIFKPHPGNMRIDKKKLYFNTSVYTEDQLKHIVDFYNKHEHLLKTNIIDYDYNQEILKYTDFGIVTYGSTICNELYIYDIPLLLLKSKKNDWTKLYSNGYNNLINQLELSKTKLQGPIRVSNTSRNYELAKADKIISDKIISDKILSIRDKIFKILDIVYGTSEYIDNLKETPALLEKIINTNYKDTFPYFNNNPLYGNTYDAKQENIGKIILDILNNNNNSNNNSNNNTIKLNINKYNMRIFGTSFIDVNIEKEIIYIKNIQVVDKTNTNGLNLYFKLIEYNKPINISFYVKLNINENNVHFKLFTGTKWILYDKISITTTFVKVSEKINITSLKQWRMSFTSNLIDQIIEIKNLNITHQ